MNISITRSDLNRYKSDGKIIRQHHLEQDFDLFPTAKFLYEINKNH